MNALSAHTQSIDYCTYCPKLCRHVCPVSNATGQESLIPQQKMATLGEMAQGLRPWQPDFASVLYACTGCRRCQTACAHEIDVSAALEVGRAFAQTRGAGHPALTDFANRFHQHSQHELARLQDRYPPNPRADVALWPGCDAFELVDSTLRALEKAGISAALAKMPFASAGHTLLAAGYVDAFREVAQANAQTLSHIRTVAVSCPGCLHALLRQYPEFGFRLHTRVVHPTELLAPHAAALTPDRTVSHALYHDACYLGRHLGVYEPPRQLVARCALTWREFPCSRDNAVCSGGGGLLSLTNPQAAAEIAKARVAEAQSLGADAILTACPTSRRQLRAAAGTTVAVLDILELIATG